MQKVKGIGGIFFKTSNPETLAQWYHDTLGVPVIGGGFAIFDWNEASVPGTQPCTVWSAMPADTDYLGKSRSPFMINYIVDSLDPFVAQLRAAGVKLEDKIEQTEQGRFAWGYDPEGNKFELWEPAKAG